MRVRQEGSAPTKLLAHTAVGFGSRLFIFGGGDGKRMSAELFTLDLRTHAGAVDDPSSPIALIGAGAGLVATAAAVVAAAAATAAPEGAGGTPSEIGELIACWGHPQVRGPAPPPRVGHCATRLGETVMLVFGGFSAGDGYSNALYTLNVERLQWLQPTGSVAVMPR
jgi:hypothetical protein